jgi:hypothetical protein
MYYNNALKHRFDGEYKKIPTYTISKNGVLIENFDSSYYSEFFGNEDIDKNSIIICLENL